MKIYSTQQMAAIYRKTIDSGITQIELLSRVADSVACEIIDRWKYVKPLIVFAGPGRKGAEALATALLLLDQGFKPEVYIVNRGGEQLCAEGVALRDELLSHEKEGVKVTEFIKTIVLPAIKKNHLIIDGLFGPELAGGIQGGLKDLVQIINTSGATIVSIENPSGLPGDLSENIVNNNCIKASLTLAIHAGYPTFFLDETNEVTGEVKVLDIGLDGFDDVELGSFCLIEQGDVSSALKKRKANSSKANYGTCAIITGQYGMMGASVLSAKGALRSGVGKATIVTPRCGFNIIQTSVPEALFSSTKDDCVISEMQLHTHYDAIGVGPGIGINDKTVDALEELLNKSHEHMVIDADALNCIAKRPRLINFIPVNSVITPHKAEFDRIFGEHTSDRERLMKAIEVAQAKDIIIVLKGHYTAIVNNDGKVFFNSSGTPALATAGSGDVLTGVITSFIAQGYQPAAASILGVFIHGTAGQLAEEVHGSYGVTASDIADNIGKAIKYCLSSI